jgi:Tfp pilus assembly protein PilO
VTITDRDKKVLLLLVPLALAAAYWFLLLAPKRDEETKIQDQLTQAQTARDTAEQRAAGLAGAKQNFASDYAAVIYLGKSIPANVDMPSLLVQLDRAARGTGIQFTSVQTGERVGLPATGGTAPTDGSAPPAQSAPGAAAQNATNAVDNSNNASTAAQGGAPTDPAAAGASPDAAGTPALEIVPLDFQFNGSFFDLADFFHRMKRFVRVANDQIIVRGRLMTINNFSFDARDTFPQITATVHATVYLAPKAQGVAAGASPQGPQGASPAQPDGQQTASSESSPSPTPAATVTVR